MVDGSVIIDTKLDKSGAEKGLSQLGNLAKKGLKTVAVGIGAVATAVTGVVTASVKARGEIEQQIGGVKKLFKSASDIVIKNSEKAYKTAGLSAVDYMTTITNFSASLISSLNGDVKKSAKIADRAIQDMSDNANTFGTDISLIQNAYQRIC